MELRYRGIISESTQHPRIGC